MHKGKRIEFCKCFTVKQQKSNNLILEKIINYKVKQKNKKPEKTIVDVRRPDEYEKAHATGTINIPLNEISARLDEITEISTPIVLVCGGGTRHVKAFELLKSNGIECEKGGSWKDIK